MLGSPWTFSDLVEPSPNRTDPLAFRGHSQTRPSGLCAARSAFAALRDTLVPTEVGDACRTTIALRAEGSHFAVPVRAGRGRARERLPSCRELASRSSPAELAPTFDRERLPHTLSPSLRSCLASGGASSFLPASALRDSSTRSCDSEVGKARDASNRLLPPMRNCVYPYRACSWLAPRLSPRGCRSVEVFAFAKFFRSKVALAIFTESWAPCGVPGDRMLHGIRERFGGPQSWTRAAVPLFQPHDCVTESERGRCLPTAPMAIEPLTPLSPLPLSWDKGALARSFVRGMSERLRALSSPGSRSAFALLSRGSFEPRSPA